MKQVLLVGSPNSGKSMLFNRLTGLNQRVANFPGITVSTHAGSSRSLADTDIVDYPGVYSMNPLSGEEDVAIKTFSDALRQDPEKIAAIVCVVDATRLEKGLFFALQVLEACRHHGHKMIVATNMCDVLEKHNMAIDAIALSAELGVPVVPVSAKTNTGVDALEHQISHIELKPPLASGTLIASDENSLRNRAEQLAIDCGPKGDLLLLSNENADSFFLNTLTGGISFFAIMYLLFQSIFTWAAPVMDAIETAVIGTSELILPYIAEGWIHDFVADAIFGGLGAFLVFVPQIFVLTLVVGLMEDSGYLARAAVICHRPLSWFGLTGKSFVPMLSGVACAIPGIYAARTIESPAKRFLTYLAIPLMPCSARLPVYGLLIAAFIPAESIAGGWIGLQGLTMFGIYLLGICVGLLVSAVVSKMHVKDLTDTPFILEMPPYRLPGLTTLIRHAWERSGDFVKRAGPVIFWVSVVIWALGYFPNMGADLGKSWLGYLGHLIEPVFAPLGLDWKYGVAVLASFLAREVFVGTLGTLFGIEGTDESVVSLATHIQESGLPLASGLSMLVFFALAAQCVSTLATLYRESGSAKLPLQMFVAYGLIAYGMALLTYNIFI